MLAHHSAPTLHNTLYPYGGDGYATVICEGDENELNLGGGWAVRADPDPCDLYWDDDEDAWCCTVCGGLYVDD